MNFIAPRRRLRTKGINSRRSITKISQLVFAVASAVRAKPSSTATSRKSRPRRSDSKSRCGRRREETLIFTVPLITAIKLLPGSPLETIVAPRSAWNVWHSGRADRKPQDRDRKNTDVAQHSQFAARKRPRYSFIIFGHPIIQQFHVAHHRRIALPARLAESDRPPHCSIIRRLDAHSKKAPVSSGHSISLPVKDRPPDDGSSHLR